MFLKCWRLKTKSLTMLLFLMVLVLFFLLITKDSTGGMRNLSLMKNQEDDILAKERAELNANIKKMQDNFLRMEAEVKMEKMKEKMLEKDVQMKEKEIEMKEAEIRAIEAEPKSELSEAEQSFVNTQTARKARFDEVCAAGDSEKGMVSFLLTGREGLTYCVIPKTARTFWFQVYRYLNRDLMGHEDIMSPLDLDPKESVKKSFLRTKHHNWARLKQPQKDDILNSKIFLTVQSPYQRLWLTYVSNLLLPAKWATMGIKIEKSLKKPVARGAEPLDKMVYVSGRQCGISVTFEQFVAHAVETFEVDYYPYYKQCDPCTLHPTYVIKEETSMADTEHVLKLVGLDWVAKQANFTEIQELKKVKQIVKDSFTVMKQTLANGCGTEADIGQRIWKAMEAYGLCPLGLSHPPVKFKDGEEAVLSRAFKLYRMAQEKGNDRIVTRRTTLIKALKTLKPDTISKVQARYKQDFDLFGYATNIEDLDISLER